jgi:glycosyltransferase involved in cell wall biosynthesis
MRVVIAHDWLTNWHGAEKVLAEMVKVTGATEIVTAVADRELTDRMLPGIKIRTLWPDRLPGAKKGWSRYALPLMAAWATAEIEADLLLVSSFFAAHGATVRFTGPSVVYYHSPARILWRPDLELQRLRPIMQPLARAALPTFRAFDRWVAQHPTTVLANSSSIADRIQQAYGREAEVVHPPVDVERWSRIPRGTPRHVLWLGRLVAYKQPELAMRACAAAGLRLVMVGDGPERERLEALGIEGVTFLGRADDAVVEQAMSGTIALIHPGEEDFGISAVEAQAAGAPVVALEAGGARDTVIHAATGLLVAECNVEEFATALQQCMTHAWERATLETHAATFSAQAFREHLSHVLMQPLHMEPALAAKFAPGLPGPGITR